MIHVLNTNSQIILYQSLHHSKITGHRLGHRIFNKF